MTTNELLQGSSERNLASLVVGVDLEQFGIRANDPALNRFADISLHFADLRLPLVAFPPDQRDAMVSQPTKFTSRDFVLGIDYFFGKNQGNPRSVRENAAAAIFDGRQGVPLWRIMRSVAYATPKDPLVIVHLRADRQIDTQTLCTSLGIDETNLSRADVSTLGLEYGTVNPFATANTKIRHIFDRDLVDGKDYPDDDVVFTSSGDPRFYVGFDVRRYIMAVSGLYASFVTRAISRPAVDEETTMPIERVIARRPITIIGGDSGIDTANFARTIMTSITKLLEAKDAYFGDRSLTDFDIRSSREIAGSIDTGLYGRKLQKYIDQVADQIGKSPGRYKPLVTFSSMAMHGIVGDILRQSEAIDYIGPQEAVEQVLTSLQAEGVVITHMLLLGLPSVYDSGRSAFAGKILDEALRMREDAQVQIQEFVRECKVKPQQEIDSNRLYQIIEKALRRATPDISTLNGKTVVVVLAASELGSYVSAFHKVPNTFAAIKSSDPVSIAEEIGKASENKIRIVFVQPGQVLADTIAEKTLEPVLKPE